MPLKTVNAAQPWARRAGIVGIPPVPGVVHGAAPFILTACLGRIEELLPLPADEGRRLCFRSRRRQKCLEGAGRTAIIGNVEPGRHSERQQKPYPDAETGMPRPGGSQKGKQAGHDRNASFAKQVIDVSVHVKKGRIRPVARVQIKRGFLRKSRQQNRAYSRNEVAISGKSPGCI